MALKDTQYQFQVTADNQISVSAIITIDGVTAWSGELAHNNEAVHQVFGVYGFNYQPFSPANFQIDVPSQTAFAGGSLNHKLCTISVTGGNIMLCRIGTKNNPMFEPDPVTGNPVYIGGNPNLAVQYKITTQPLWDGQALLNRYNIAVNDAMPGQPAGDILLLSGETCEFTLAITDYFSVIT